MLLPMILSLVGPYALITGLEKLRGSVLLDRSTKGRIGVSFFLLGPAVSHFVQAQAMQDMLPPWVPYRLEVIYVTGVFEVLGAIAIWVPGLTRIAGNAIILMLLCFLPANIYASFNYVDYGGSAAGPLYLLIRVPFQFFVMWWVYWATRQTWLQSVSRQTQETP